LSTIQIEGNGFGNQLSDDKREIGDDYHSGDHGQITCIGFRSRYEGEEWNKVVCDSDWYHPAKHVSKLSPEKATNLHVEY